MYKSAKSSIEFTLEDSFVVDFGLLHEIFITDAEIYRGDYTVDPDFTKQSLPTKSKLMVDDIAVNAIEVQRVSNNAGGRTVYIGGIIDG